MENIKKNQRLSAFAEKYHTQGNVYQQVDFNDEQKCIQKFHQPPFLRRKQGVNSQFCKLMPNFLHACLKLLPIQVPAKSRKSAFIFFASLRMENFWRPGSLCAPAPEKAEVLLHLTAPISVVIAGCQNTLCICLPASAIFLLLPCPEHR